jgi:enamine deaminase RidA (YjgF/YER057c/UK114 family)
MAVYEKLEALHITLPQPVPPVAALVPFVRAGNLLFLSGHIAKKDGKPWAGHLGLNVTTEQGKAAARSIAIDLMGDAPRGAG